MLWFVGPSMPRKLEWERLNRIDKAKRKPRTPIIAGAPTKPDPNEPSVQCPRCNKRYFKSELRKHLKRAHAQGKQFKPLHEEMKAKKGSFRKSGGKKGPVVYHFGPK